MKQIQLSKGMVALVDDADFEELSRYKWRYVKKPKDKTGYAYRQERAPSERKKHRYKRITMHGAIIAGLPTGSFVDHADRNGLNNQRSNLRICTLLENNRNQGKRNDSGNQYRGIKYLKANGRVKRWIARIRVDGKRVESNSFATAREAAVEYNRLAVLYHGEFAGLNEL